MFCNLTAHEITTLGHLIANEIYCSCPEEAHIYESLAKQVYTSLDHLNTTNKCHTSKPCKCHK